MTCYRIAATLLLSIGAGCSPPTSVPDDDDGGFDAAESAPRDGADSGIPAWEVEIRVGREPNGVPDRLYCLARTLDDAGVALLIDTGSQFTFLTLPPGSPDFVPDAGALWLGDTLFPFAGRPYDVGESIEGRPVIGTLGNDFLFATTTELDLSGQRLRRIAGPWDARGWTPLPYENVQNYIYVRVQVDDRAVRLGLDTGSSDTLVLDAGREPGDQVVMTTDAEGDVLTLYLGTGVLSWNGLGPRVVPIYRTPSFAYLEATAAIVGGEIDGLFGLSSWPSDRARFEPGTSTVWFSASRDGGS